MFAADPSVDPARLWVLPSGFKDYTNVFAMYSALEVGDRAVLLGRVSSDPCKRTKPFRLEFEIGDRAGHSVPVTIFHPAPDLYVERGAPIAVQGKVAVFRDRLSLSGDLVPRQVVGRIVATYADKSFSLPDPETLNEHALVSATWAASKIGCEPLARLLGCVTECVEEQLASLLLQAHAPDSMEEAEQARQLLDTVAAGAVVTALAVQKRKKAAFILNPESARFDLDYLADGLPFQITHEQRAACIDCIADMSSGNAMSRVLMGGVGSGKTVSYGLVAAVSALQGAAVGILCPTQLLAEQVAREIGSFWPEVEVQLVASGDSRRITPWPRMIFVGTTALLSRLDSALDLVITDEQHKFNVAQRSKLSTLDGHRLEVSATLIPRTMALASLGVMMMSEIRQMHSDRTLKTYLVRPEQKASLFKKLEAAVNAGEKLLVICAKKGDDQASAKQAVKSAAALWEKHFPGKVQALDGDMTADQKAAAQAVVKSGERRILISTTVVEVGITIPGLKLMIILDPDRYGLTQLHQLRGRLARQGGVGHCFLYKEEAIPADALPRLEVFCKTTDDFEIARKDMELRGAGDLLGETEQHGGTPSPIYPKGQHCSMAALLEAAERLGRRAAA